MVKLEVPSFHLEAFFTSDQEDQSLSRPNTVFKTLFVGMISSRLPDQPNFTDSVEVKFRINSLIANPHADAAFGRPGALSKTVLRILRERNAM
jgi:hypothetical protein